MLLSLLNPKHQVFHCLFVVSLSLDTVRHQKDMTFIAHVGIYIVLDPGIFRMVIDFTTGVAQVDKLETLCMLVCVYRPGF